MSVTRAEIVASRARLLEAVVSFFSSDAGVGGIYLAGSLAAGTADAYSDIDLRVVASPPEHERLVAARLTAPASWGQLLFNEWIEGTRHCVSHFRPFVKIDVFYLDVTELIPSPWLKLPTHVFLDRSGQVRDVIARSMRLPFPRPAIREISRILSKAFAGAHEVIRRTRRGELLHAQSLLSEFRDHISQLDKWLNGLDDASLADFTSERRLSATFRRSLENSFVEADAAAIELALARLVEVLAEQVVAAHRGFGLDRSLQDDLYSLQLVTGREIE